MKKGDRVKTNLGAGEVIQVYWSASSGKAYKVKVMLGCGCDRFFYLSDVEVIGG